MSATPTQRPAAQQAVQSALEVHQLDCNCHIGGQAEWAPVSRYPEARAILTAGCPVHGSSKDGATTTTTPITTTTEGSTP